MNQLQEFIQVFGQRFIGLVDNINLYQTYRVPVPEAPYPQDYIIDQQGIIRYWSDEYDPQEIIKIIDGLLNTNLNEPKTQIKTNELLINISSNPVRSQFTVSSPLLKYPDARLKIYNVLGKLIKEIKPATKEEVTISIAERGVIFIVLEVNNKEIKQKIIISE
jgi:hypothetical protein